VKIGRRPDQSLSWRASFFSRDIGIEIYDEAYGDPWGFQGQAPKGVPRKSATRLVAKALLTLWELRELERAERGEDDKVPQSNLSRLRIFSTFVRRCRSFCSLLHRAG
jgi:hypothetical protein